MNTLADDTIDVYYDGACEPKNPGGHASCGVVIKQGRKVLFEESRYIGFGPQCSNNVAEYSGMIAGMEYLITNRMNDLRVIFHGDSMLSVRQMMGEWRVKGGLYLPYFTKAKELAGHFKNITFVWIPRERNSEADILSKKVLKERGVSFRIQAG
jgi:ribonuclease HI